METFHDRLKLASARLSTREIARRSGLSEGTLRAYLKGTSFPNLDKIPDLAKALDVRPAWLATGDEPMHAEECVKKCALPTTGKLANEEAFLVPHLDLEASAGYGTLDQQELVVEYVAFKPEYLRNELGVSLDKLVLIRARGDSMIPTIQDGDLLLIDHAQIVDRTDGIYLVAIGERLMVKRIQFLLDGQLEIISDNSKYRPLLVDIQKSDQVRLIGRVVWTGRRT